MDFFSAQKVNTYTLANAYLSCLPKETRDTFYKEEEGYLHYKEIIINDHISLKGYLSIFEKAAYHKDYQLQLTVIVDGIDTETYRLKLDSFYYSRFRNIQDYICKETLTLHKIPTKIIQEVNEWSKNIVIPIGEAERQEDQRLLKQAEEQFKQEEKILSMYR